MSHEQERHALLASCRAIVPGAAGVVLATLDGHALAYEPGCREPARLARDAARDRHPDAPTSAMVERDGGLYFVLFVPDALAEQWSASWETPALPAP